VTVYFSSSATKVDECLEEWLTIDVAERLMQRGSRGNFPVNEGYRRVREEFVKSYFIFLHVW
jgi:hypothetical protein